MTVTKAELEQKLAELEAARDSAIADLQRVAADFDNYRKRVARESAQLSQRANERLLNELLPVLDDLERALEAAAEHNRTPEGEAKLEEGIRLVHRSLLGLCLLLGARLLAHYERFASSSSSTTS